MSQSAPTGQAAVEAVAALDELLRRPLDSSAAEVEPLLNCAVPAFSIADLPNGYVELSIRHVLLQGITHSSPDDRIFSLALEAFSRYAKGRTRGMWYSCETETSLLSVLHLARSVEPRSELSWQEIRPPVVTASIGVLEGTAIREPLQLALVQGLLVTIARAAASEIDNDEPWRAAVLLLRKIAASERLLESSSTADAICMTARQTVDSAYDAASIQVSLALLSELINIAKVHRTDAGPEASPIVLEEAVASLLERHALTGDSDDLAEAVSVFDQWQSVAPALPIASRASGIALKLQFGRTSDREDLVQSAALEARRFVSEYPYETATLLATLLGVDPAGEVDGESHVDRATRLIGDPRVGVTNVARLQMALGLWWLNRFRSSGEVNELQRASMASADLDSETLPVVERQDSYKVKIEIQLALAQLESFETVAIESAADEALKLALLVPSVSYVVEAVQIARVSYRFRGTSSALRRFAEAMNLASDHVDLTETRALQYALALLESLAIYGPAFERDPLEVLQDVRQGLTSQYAAAESEQERIQVRSAQAEAEYLRYSIADDISALRQAIEWLEELETTGSLDGDGTARLSAALRDLFVCESDVRYLRRARDLAQQNVDENAGVEHFYGVLAAAWYMLAEIGQSGSALEEALDAAEKALACSVDRLVRPETLSNYSAILRMAFRWTGEREYLERSLAASLSAVELSDGLRLQGSYALRSLLNSALLMAEDSHSTAEHAEAILAMVEEVATQIGPAHSLYASVLNTRAIARSLTLPTDRRALALGDFATAWAVAENGGARRSLAIALGWCRCAVSVAAGYEPAAWRDAQIAARHAVGALREAILSQTDRRDAIGWSDLSDDLPSLAAYVCLQGGDPDGAVELLELSRAVSLRSHALTIPPLPVERTYVIATELGGALVHVSAAGSEVEWVPRLSSAWCSEIRRLFDPRTTLGSESGQDAVVAGGELGRAVGLSLRRRYGSGHAEVIPVGDAAGIPYGAALVDEEDGPSPICSSMAVSVHPASFVRELSFRTQRKSPVSIVDEGLPRARNEARQFLDGLGGGEIVLTSQPKSEVLDRIADASVVHFACHAEVDELSPWRSAISLGANGVLTAEEVISASHNLSLVVLAACWTGAPTLRGSHEVI